MGDGQSYSYALPSGYVSVYRPPIQPVRRMGYSPYSNYYNYQPIPISRRFYPSRATYTYRSLPQRVPISANIVSTNIGPKQPDAPNKLVVPYETPAKTTPEARSSVNEQEKDSEKGFKLLEILVETVSQAASTATDSDAAEVDAVKSIFADVIDEIIRQVQMKFKENNLDTYRVFPQRVPISANLLSTNIGPKQPDAPAKIVVPYQTPAETTPEAHSSVNEQEKDAEKGFTLLDNLVETVSQAAGTATDSDVAEVDAVKSIFADVIDEIIRQVQMKFKENNLDTSISNGFLRKSQDTKKAVSEASNQTIIATILKPYVTELKYLLTKVLKRWHHQKQI